MGWAPDWCSNPLNAWCSESQDNCENHCNGVFCPDEAAVEAALAAEEITTELLAAEVVNTTTAGFTTGGLAETQDLQQQQKSSGNRCCGQAPGGVPGSCWAPDWRSNPLDAWCSQSQDRCEKHCRVHDWGSRRGSRPTLRLLQQRRLRIRVPPRAGDFLLPVLERGGQQPSAQQMPPVLHRVLNRAGYDECSTEPVKPLVAV